MSPKSGFLIVSNGFFIENVGHTLTKNYNGTYGPELLGKVLSMICIANIYNHIIVKLFYVKDLPCVFLDHDILVSAMSFITKLYEAEILTRSYRYFIIHMPFFDNTVANSLLPNVYTKGNMK